MQKLVDEDDDPEVRSMTVSISNHNLHDFETLKDDSIQYDPALSHLFDFFER